MKEFTEDEIRVLKELARNALFLERLVKKDKEGNDIERGSYSDWATAMKKGGKNE